MWTRFNETHLAQMRYLRSLTESYDRWPVLQEGAISWLSWKRENDKRDRECRDKSPRAHFLVDEDITGAYTIGRYIVAFVLYALTSDRSST
jgi:hypothetical protein